MDGALSNDEIVVLTTRKHWLAPIADSRWAIVMVFASFAVGWFDLPGFFGRTIELVQLGLFFVGVAWIVVNLVAWRTAAYSVSNRRVLSSDGLIQRRTTDTLLTSITDVLTLHSAVGRALGYGSVRIVSPSGAAGGEVFTSLCNAEEFAKEILNQKAANTNDLPSGATALEIMELLEQLATLRDAAALTEDEYNATKTKLLAQL
jgi:uncharacterized membrane protein YdbT with pleckstrin-like domain